LALTLRGERSRGNNVSQQDAIDAGLHTRLLESMIARSALYAYADKIGVSASDTLVANRIREIPNVQNPVTGAFDETAYQTFLGELRYTQPDFEEEIRGELTAQVLMSSLVLGVRPPASFGALELAYNAETRVITLAEAPASAVGAIPAPTEAQLQTFWEENADNLRVPEFRALTLVYARPEDFIPRVTVSEDRLREEFEARLASLTRPERRTYVRLSAQNEAQANDAAARLARGESADSVARALSLQVARGENQTREEVTDARVAEAVFALQPRAARAVQGQLSPWVVVRLESITPSVTPTFAEQRDQLRQLIAADEAADLLNEAIRAFEDARAAGTPLAEAARQAGLAVVAVPAVEEGGRAQNGAPVEALAGQEDVLSTAFQTAEGEATDFMPVGGADVVVGVERIIPASVRPLADVREGLIEAWTGRERARLLRELGATLTSAVSGGQSFANALRANHFVVRVRSASVDREHAAQIPANGLPAQIFAASEGAIVSGLRADGGAIVVAQVERINRPDLSAAAQAIEANRARAQQTLGASFAETVQNQIVAQANVRRNTDLLDRSFPRTGAESDEQEQ
jgi:peptidyl-prolyl cis-trans isomerase D